MRASERARASACWFSTSSIKNVKVRNKNNISNKILVATTIQTTCSTSIKKSFHLRVDASALFVCL